MFVVVCVSLCGRQGGFGGGYYWWCSIGHGLLWVVVGVGVVEGVGCECGFGFGWHCGGARYYQKYIV